MCCIFLEFIAHQVFVVAGNVCCVVCVDRTHPRLTTICFDVYSNTRVFENMSTFKNVKFGAGYTLCICNSVLGHIINNSASTMNSGNSNYEMGAANNLNKTQ